MMTSVPEDGEAEGGVTGGGVAGGGDAGGCVEGGVDGAGGAGSAGGVGLGLSGGAGETGCGGGVASSGCRAVARWADAAMIDQAHTPMRRCGAVRGVGIFIVCIVGECMSGVHPRVQERSIDRKANNRSMFGSVARYVALVVKRTRC